MNATPLPVALQVVHGYNEPFLSLAALYTRALRQAGWRVVTVYLTGPSDEAVRTASEADEVVFLDAGGAALRGLKLQRAWQLRALVQQHAASLLVAQRYKSWYLALLATLGRTVPVLGVGHAFGILDSGGRRWWLQRFRHRLRLAGVSQAVTADLQQHAGRVPCLPLPNAIDTTAREARLYTRAVARRQLGLAETAFVFGNVGRLHPDKDQGTLIRAFAAIAPAYPHARLVLVGQGRCEQDYRALAASLQVKEQVILTGPVPEAPSLFPAFDAYVSASDREPFGIVLCEAMLARLPVISTDCGGAPEVLGEHGLYFRSRDVPALAAHMRQLLEATPAIRQQQGEQLYARLQERFSFPAFRQRLQTALATLPGLAG